MAKRSSKNKTGEIQLSKSGSLSDSEIEELVSHLWENIDGLPAHIQTLLHESQEGGTPGAVSYMLAAGWAIGKFDYVFANPWSGTKGGWVPKEKDVN